MSGVQLDGLSADAYLLPAVLLAGAALTSAAWPVAALTSAAWPVAALSGRNDPS
ncbi:hypothetical protein [Streptomyces zaomyceticus]|uniref:hypothetical protein n=1 Tax=Streptomyces zaomyceticus TaxID=68286 RepID=UPI0034456FB1